MAYSISYIYQIIDRYSAPLNKINNVTKKFSTSVNTVHSKVGKLGNSLGGLQTGLAGLATALGGKQLMDTFTSFETNMNKLESVTFANTDQMARLRDMAKKLGATTKYTAGEAAEGMTYLAMAGLDTEQILQAIPGALQLASAGALSLGEAADIATNVLGQMKMSVEDLARVNDVLAMAQSKANFNVTELFEAMRPVATTAKSLGIDLEELTAHLGVMANAGEKGSIAGTLLRNALTNIAGATTKQKAIYKALGIDFGNFVDKTGKIKNLKGLVGELQRVEKEGKLTVPVLQALYGDRGFRAIQILAGAGAGAVAELQEKLTGAAGAAEKAANIQMKGLPGILATIAAAFEAVTVSIFESGLDKIIIKIGKAIIWMAQGMSKAHPVIRLIIGVIGGLIVILVPLIALTAALAVAINAVIAPVWIVIGILAALAAAVAVVIYYWDNIVAGFKIGIKAIVSAFKWLWNGVKIVVTKVGAFFVGLGVKIKEGAVAMLRIFKWLVTKIPLVAAFLAIRKNWDSIMDGILAGVSKITGAFSKVKSFFGFGGGEEEKGVSAQAASNTTATLNGMIAISAQKGTQVETFDLTSTMPGNLGFNMAGGY